MNFLGDISKLSTARTRSISPENYNGAKGNGARCELADGTTQYAARGLGKGWKVNPCIRIPAGQTWTIADIEGPGTIQHMWFTISGYWRFSILRIYWDDQEYPSVECPLSDFFCSGWGKFAQLSSLAVCVNPTNGFNCYWPMPFRKHCRITVENLDDEQVTLFYQITYALCEVAQNEAYFHAQFHRVNPLPYQQVYTLLDGVKGRGQYVGTYMAWGAHNGGWWGEGEIKFYLDGDDEYPTICGTGTEDYFCGSYAFEDPDTRDHYRIFTTPHVGLHQVLTPDKLYNTQFRFGMYRWHLADPIRFEQELRITMQALGGRKDGRFMPLQDDIASVAYWYQTLPSAPLFPLPDRDILEII